MRFEATLPRDRGEALVELARELGISRSQLMDEALSLFLKAVIEARRGRRLMLVDPCDETANCELSIPTLSHLEWARLREAIELSTAEMEKLTEALAAPAAPTPALKTIMKGRGKKERRGD